MVWAGTSFADTPRLPHFQKETAYADIESRLTELGWRPLNSTSEGKFLWRRGTATIEVFVRADPDANGEEERFLFERIRCRTGCEKGEDSGQTHP
jgi:hypothetical protein